MTVMNHLKNFIEIQTLALVIRALKKQIVASMTQIGATHHWNVITNTITQSLTVM